MMLNYKTSQQTHLNSNQKFALRTEEKELQTKIKVINQEKHHFFFRISNFYLFWENST